MIPTQTYWKRNETSAKGTLRGAFAYGKKAASPLRIIKESVLQLSTRFGVKNSDVAALLVQAVNTLLVLPSLGIAELRLWHRDATLPI